MFASLLELYPKHVEMFWDYSRNTLLPSEVSIGAHAEVYFLCGNGHSFKASVSRLKRVEVEKFCRECQSLAFVHPELLPFFNHDLNKQSPTVFKASGGRGVWLNCQYGHVFKASGIKGFENALKQCRECRSFRVRYPERFAMWNYDRNNINVGEVNSRTGTCWFKCVSGHEFKRNPFAKTSRNFCPKCNYLTVFEAHPYAVDYWDWDRNTLDPKQISVKTNGKFWFKCPKRGHSFHRNLKSLDKQSREFCPECRLLDYSFKALYPDSASMWDHSRNTVDPDLILPGVGGYFWFKCVKGHEFKRSLKSMFSGLCPVCYSSESALERSIRAFIDGQGYSNVVYNSRKLIKPFELDIYLPELNKAIEVNGDYWHCDAQVRVKTRFKTASELHSFKHDLASSKGIELAFIWGHDWDGHFESVSGELLDWLVSGSSVSMYPLLSKLDSVIDEPCVKC